MKEQRLLMITMFLLLLVGVGQIYAATTPADVSLSFQGEVFNAEGNLLVKDQVKYINLNFLTRQLKVTTTWKPGSALIRIKTGKNIYDLQKDQVDYRTENQVKQLTAAPYEQGGELWIPVEFLSELGVAVLQDDEKSLVLGWADHYLLAVESLTYQGRPALALLGSQPLSINSFLLREPDRLVIDFAGFKAGPGLDPSAITNQMVQKVRFSQFQADTLRVVCDLTQKGGYQIITDPQNANRLIITFDCLVQTISFSSDGDAERVRIKTNFPATYKVTTFTKPNRVAIDFANATLADQTLTVEGKGRCFKSVRVGQYDLQTVRVVIDLANTGQPYRVFTSSRDPRIIEARTVQTVKSIECDEITPQITKLVIKGTGELTETIHKLKHPSKLQIDLDFFSFGPGLKAPGVNQFRQLKGIKLIKLGPTQARIEAELNYLAGYEVTISEDYQQLVVTFIKSPIINQLIVLDPGHGGVDMGATGKLGTREKNINLEVALDLKELLEEAGARVVLTRNDDYFISLYERNFIANQLVGDLFVSVHTNFHPNASVCGIEVYYYKGRSDGAILAQKVLEEMVKQTGLNSLGVKNNDFVVIRETLMPSILVELGYISNEIEERVVRTAKFKKQAALGIYHGIIAYYNTKQPS